MSAATTSMDTLLRPNTERVRRHKDGSVLLSISDDRICKLNSVGALTWIVLEDATTELTLDEVVPRLQEQFEAINREGEFSYEVSPEQLRSDTASFLCNLAAMNLVEQIDGGGEPAYRIAENVSGTTCNTAVGVSSSPAVEAAAKSVHVNHVSRRETITAFVGLLAFDLLLKFRGFKSVIEKVHRWPMAKPRQTDLEICRHVRAMVDQAQMYYPKKAMCLQHSAVVTCLLRQRGVPAEMVLAAHEFPIRVHAWSEVEGYVVNDRQSVKNMHREMRRV
jgi:Transglutaminase-like superfamily